MASLEFGIGFRDITTASADARNAEALGYDFITCGEHVFFHGAADNSLVALAAAAGATQRIRLMSTITLAPLYPAALLAKQVATLDRVSNGRFHLGVGVGGEIEEEFQACGVPINERGARTDEALHVLKRLCTEDDVRFEGRFCRLEGVTLNPKPIQSPHPPIWISGRSEAAMKRCARDGNGWLPYMFTPARLATSLQDIRKFAADVERDDEITGGILLPFVVHEQRQRAIDMASETLSALYQQDFAALIGKYAIAGNPDDCIERLREYIDAGARTIIFNSACPASYVAENESLLATKVLPSLKSS